MLITIWSLQYLLLKGVNLKQLKWQKKSHDLYTKLGNVGQSKYSPYIKVHEEFILTSLFPQTINNLVGSKFKFLKTKLMFFTQTEF